MEEYGSSGFRLRYLYYSQNDLPFVRIDFGAPSVDRHEAIQREDAENGFAFGESPSAGSFTGRPCRRDGLLSVGVECGAVAENVSLGNTEPGIFSRPRIGATRAT